VTGGGKMPKIIKWIRIDRLMKRWNLYDYELRQVIDSGVLSVYEAFTSIEPKPDEVIEDGYTKLNDDRIKDYELGEMRFKIDDIEKFENENPNFIQSDSLKMTAKQSREFGQLKLEKKKWDQSIKAAVEATLFCKDQKIPVTRNQLWDHLLKNKLGDIPDTTFEKIWKAIPQKYRSKGGRPKKAKTKVIKRHLKLI
jgi:hypothetical protein